MTQAVTLDATPRPEGHTLVVAKEVNKLVAMLRNTARFAAVGDTSGDPDYLEKLSRTKYERGGAHAALMVALRICIDPSISAPITAAALEAAGRMFQVLSAKEKTDSVNQVVHLACKTQFAEVDRERDELVYLALLNLLRTCLSEEDAAKISEEHIDEAWTVVQRIAFSVHSSAVLGRIAKDTLMVLGLCRFQLPGGEVWLTQDFRRQLEAAVNQMHSSSSSSTLVLEERLDLLVDLLIAINQRSRDIHLLVEYSVTLLLFHLMPAGQAASSNEGSVVSAHADGAVLKNTGLYAVLGKVLALAVQLLSSTEDFNTVERLLMALLRPLAITSPEDSAMSAADDQGYGEQAVANVVVSSGNTTRRRWFNSPRILGLCVDAITESCRLNPRLMIEAFARLDADWRRVPVATVGVLDSVCSVILGSLAVDFSSGISTRAKIQALLASLPDALVMDPPGQRLGSAEHAGVRFLAEALRHTSEKSGGGKVLPKTSAAAEVLEVRRAVVETLAQIREKPKKTREVVEKLLTKYPSMRGIEAVDPVMEFLRESPGMPLEALGEFLGQPGNEGEVLKYVETFDLKKMDIEETMRTVLATFRLPGEAQQISRVVEGIAKAHFLANDGGGRDQGIFKSVDAEYTFLFSVIMLNTDQHNPNVTKRMELKDFLRNNRGINDGNDIDEDYQIRIFNSIRSQQILTPKNDSLWAPPLWVRLLDHNFRTTCGGGVGDGWGVRELVETRGYDLLAALSYASNMDPEDGDAKQGGSSVVECLGRLAELSFGLLGESGNAGGNSGVLRDLADDTVAVLRRNAINLFSGSMAKCRRNLRSLETLLMLGERFYSSALMQAVSEAVILYSVYAVVLIEGSAAPSSAASSPGGSGSLRMAVQPLSAELQAVVGTKEVGNSGGGGGGGGGLSGFLMKALFVEEPMTPEEQEGRRGEDWMVAEEVYWRWMIPEGLEEGAMVMELLEVLRREKNVLFSKTKITGRILVSCFELLTRPSCPEYLLHSGPWMILLALRLAEDQEEGGGELDVPVLVACLKLVARGLLEKTESNVRAMKVNVTATLLLMRRLSMRDATHCDSSWLGEYLKEVVKNVEVAQKISISVGQAIKRILMDADKNWIKKFSIDVWRGFLVALEVCGKSTSSEIFRDCLDLVFVNDSFAEKTHSLTDEALNVFEVLAIHKTIPISKALLDLTQRIAPSGGNKLKSGPLTCWLAVYSRICLRVVAATKILKKSDSLSDEISTFRTLLSIASSLSLSLTSTQAVLILEKAVSVLSAVVVLPSISSSFVQSLVSIFNRFFLSVLDLLVAHPHFDQLWLMVLRSVLLAVKRGSDAQVDDGLYDVVTENLKNTLQLLVQANVIDFPATATTPTSEPVWWKVTWDSVAMFCPGLVDEIRAALRPQSAAHSSAAQSSADAAQSSAAQSSASVESAESSPA